MDWKALVRKIAGKIAGVNKLQEQIDGLHYVLNACVDIQSFPKATGNLRKLQEGDTLLLRIVDCICKKHDLPYWLDSGTFLGAVRHKGFIPWDDDMDICMLRDDYERAMPIMREELARYGIDATESEDDQGARIGIGYRHRETGLWIDLFPCECIREDLTQGDDAVRLDERIRRYKKTRRRKKKLTREALFALQKKYVADFCKKEEAKTVVYCMDFCRKPYFWRYQDMFPLKKAMFEGYEFPILKNTEQYLVSVYGDHYMHFPKSGMEHHGEENGKLQTWAAKSGTDMEQVILTLQNILDALSEESKQGSV